MISDTFHFYLNPIFDKFDKAIPNYPKWILVLLDFLQVIIDAHSDLKFEFVTIITLQFSAAVQYFFIWFFHLLAQIFKLLCDFCERNYYSNVCTYERVNKSMQVLLVVFIQIMILKKRTKNQNAFTYI